jgi:hypothetical protein
MRFPRFLQNFERINWTITGAVFGIAAAILLDVYSDVERITAITAGLAVTIAIMQIGEIAQRDRTGEILGTYYRVRQDRELQHYVDEFVDTYTRVQALQDAEFMIRARNILQAFLDDLSLLAEGRLRIEPHEEMLLAIESINRCTKELQACSWRDTIEYWNLPEGRCYVDATKEAIDKRGISANRIFILKQDELEEYKDVLMSQAKLGIKIRVAFEEDLPDTSLEAYVLYDDSAVRIETWIRRSQKSATLSIDENDVKRYQRMFDEIKLRSRPLDEILPTDSTSLASSCEVLDILDREKTNTSQPSGHS